MNSLQVIIIIITIWTHNITITCIFVLTYSRFVERLEVRREPDTNKF